ncbi:MAG: hypothetical protein QX192_10910 [Methylococcales bacterium]
MIENLSETLTYITGENETIIALMRDLGVYEQMQIGQLTGKDVVLIKESHIFIWSVDDYFYYHSHDAIERERVLLRFKSCANEMNAATRH